MKLSRGTIRPIPELRERPFDFTAEVSREHSEFRSSIPAAGDILSSTVGYLRGFFCTRQFDRISRTIYYRNGGIKITHDCWIRKSMRPARINGEIEELRIWLLVSKDGLLFTYRKFFIAKKRMVAQFTLLRLSNGQIQRRIFFLSHNVWLYRVCKPNFCFSLCQSAKLESRMFFKLNLILMMNLWYVDLRRHINLQSTRGK